MGRIEVALILLALLPGPAWGQRFWGAWTPPHLALSATPRDQLKFFSEQLSSAYERLEHVARTFADLRGRPIEGEAKIDLCFAYFDEIKRVFAYLEQAHHSLGRTLEDALDSGALKDGPHEARARWLIDFAARMETVYRARFGEIYVERQRWNKMNLPNMDLQTWEGLAVRETRPKYADGLYNPIAEIEAIRATCEALLDAPGPVDDVIRGVSRAL